MLCTHFFPRLVQLTPSALGRISNLGQVLLRPTRAYVIPTAASVPYPRRSRVPRNSNLTGRLLFVPSLPQRPSPHRASAILDSLFRVLALAVHCLFVLWSPCLREMRVEMHRKQFTVFSRFQHLRENHMPHPRRNCDPAGSLACLDYCVYFQLPRRLRRKICLVCMQPTAEHFHLRRSLLLAFDSFAGRFNCSS